MKKRIGMVIATVLLVVISALALVGCIPDRPDKFMAQWMVAENYGGTVNTGGMNIEFSVSGKTMYAKYVVEEKVMAEVYAIANAKSTEYYFYDGLTSKWRYMSDASNEVSELMDQVNDLKKTLVDTIAKKADNGEIDLKATEEELGKLFEKVDGRWFARDAVGEELDKENYVVIKGNVMSICTVKEDKAMMTYILNPKITLSKEAKAAKA